MVEIAPESREIVLKDEYTKEFRLAQLDSYEPGHGHDEKQKHSRQPERFEDD